MKYHPRPSQLPFAWTSPAQCTATLIKHTKWSALHHNDVISSIAYMCVSSSRWFVSAEKALASRCSTSSSVL